MQRVAGATVRGRVVVGFDVGETLLTYEGTALIWVEHYQAALAAVAKICAATVDDERTARAADVLLRYNTRVHPRREEIPAEIIFREILLLWTLDPERHLTTAISAFFDFFQQRLTAYPETLDALKTLKREGVRLGALTDVPYGMPRVFVLRDLNGVGLDSMLDIVLTSVDVGWRKPERVGFHTLAASLDASPDQLWYVGNEEKDIVGATTAGAVAILLDREDRRPNWGQRYTLRSLSELPAILLTAS